MGPQIRRMLASEKMERNAWQAFGMIVKGCLRNVGVQFD